MVIIRLALYFRVSSLGHRFQTMFPQLRNIVNPVDTVSSYFLLSEGTSMTHWHVDFSGTSVFYSVLKGMKEFWLLK